MPWGGSNLAPAFGSRVPKMELKSYRTYLWLVGNGRMVVIVVIIVPHSSIPY